MTQQQQRQIFDDNFMNFYGTGSVVIGPILNKPVFSGPVSFNSMGAMVVAPHEQMRRFTVHANSNSESDRLKHKLDTTGVTYNIHVSSSGQHNTDFTCFVIYCDEATRSLLVKMGYVMNPYQEGELDNREPNNKDDQGKKC
jgi:hypothetical protein